ncbi:UNVERIFIED_CONTAM: hypothetical protein Slati_1773400 [Sesamum latifolium]|uniref:Uncharacterized protein n=1 Tax=Sesamum latifolium TaxID=2727402 RepID=A0AAW2WXQ9_9LAMI
MALDNVVETFRNGGRFLKWDPRVYFPQIGGTLPGARREIPHHRRCHPHHGISITVPHFLNRAGSTACPPYFYPLLLTKTEYPP